MSKKDDAEVVREVTEVIEQATKKNAKQEWIAIGTLIALFLVGLTLLGYGAWSQNWGLLAPGGVLQITIVFPIRWLIKLREQNRSLLILPQLMRLADTKEAKALAAKLVQKLIDKV